MYRESSLTGSCKSAIHLHKLRARARRPGRLSGAASTKLTRSCTERLPARAMLQMVGPECGRGGAAINSLYDQRDSLCVCVRVVCDEMPQGSMHEGSGRCAFGRGH